jgi:hypothetical protein
MLVYGNPFDKQQQWWTLLSAVCCRAEVECSREPNCGDVHAFSTSDANAGRFGEFANWSIHAV